MRRITASLLTLIAAMLPAFSPALAQSKADTIMMSAREIVADSAIKVAADSIARLNRRTHRKHSLSSQRIYTWFVEGEAVTSSRGTPFWLMNNRLGLSSTAKNNGYLRAAFFKPLDEHKRWSYGYGADIVIPYNYTSKYVVQQLYADFKYRSLHLSVGSKERFESIVDQELSSGDMTFSLNSRPLPQIYLSIPEYQSIPLLNHWVSFKGFFSLGCFSDGRWQKSHVGQADRWAESVLYHSKGFMLKAGNLNRFPVIVEGGLSMAVQFGGELQLINPVTHKPFKIKFPEKLKDILKAFIPMGAAHTDNPALAGEVNNVYGNHLGEWSAALTFAPQQSDWQFRAYYEHFFDDHSQLFLEHGWHDMLLGVAITLPQNRIVDRVLYEYIYTKDQSGAVYSDSSAEIPEQVSGRDDYYNHYMYPGWQHWGMGMGNPLLISPIYNDGPSLQFRHTRIQGHHVGLLGSPTGEIDYKILLSFTRSWGTYPDPLPSVQHNFNALLEVGYAPRRINGWSFRLGLGTDSGNILNKSVGAMLTIRKTGWK